MDHLIARQVIEVRTGSSRNAFQLQHELSELFRRLVAPELERQFDRLVGDEQLIRIDRLEIDLGVIREEDLLAGKFLPELTRLLTEALQKAIREQGPGIRKLSRAEGAFEYWLQFLEKGFMTWEGPRPTGNWLEGVKETLAQQTPAVEKLRRLVSNDPRAFERLLLQHDTPFLKTLAELYTGQSQETLLTGFQEWNELWKRAPELSTSLAVSARRDQRLLFWRQVFRWVIIEERKAPAADLIRGVVMHVVPPTRWDDLVALFRRDPQHFSLLLPIVRELAVARIDQGGVDVNSKQTKKVEKRPETPPDPSEGNSSQEEASVSEEENVPTDRVLEKEDTTREEARPADREPSEATPIGESSVDERESALTEEPSFPPAEVMPEGTEILIENAGVVLLHAFLARFFDVLELLAEGDFKDETTRHRAVQLLHFLATGEERTPEYQLPLAKLLCGVPLNMPVDAELTLSAEEREEGEALLAAVISNWDALGDVSTASLREGFLQRGGKLSKRDHDWHLQVEQQTLDILLEKLPWGIGFIKLPWMGEMLRVEWR